MGLGNPSCAPNLKSLAEAVAEYFRETPKFWGAPLVQGHPTFSSGCDFMMGLGKPKLCTKFEVASFSRCRIIKGEVTNFGELP